MGEKHGKDKKDKSVKKHEKHHHKDKSHKHKKVKEEETTPVKQEVTSSSSPKSEPGVNKKAYPLADQELTTSLLQIAQQAAAHHLIKKGANEVTKALNKGKADLIILAADTEPLEILLHLPLLCEDKDSVYVFVKSKVSLGRACGVSRPVIAVAILANEKSPIDSEVQQLKLRVERSVL